MWALRVSHDGPDSPLASENQLAGFSSSLDQENSGGQENGPEKGAMSCLEELRDGSEPGAWLLETVAVPF